jgi:hypothetical protein
MEKGGSAILSSSDNGDNPINANGSCPTATGGMILNPYASYPILRRPGPVAARLASDGSEAESIRGLMRCASRTGVDVPIARLRAGAREILARDGVLAEIGEDHIDDSVRTAVAASNGAAC